MKNLNIPVGISDFERIRELNYYYVDKTGLIKTLLQGEMDQVTLITRPRRFGKTMAMNMLNSFLDIRKDSRHLFKGLEISDEVEICEKWMNQYPTLFLSFKVQIFFIFLMRQDWRLGSFYFLIMQVRSS